MKICAKCCIEKTLAEFRDRKGGCDGLRNECKTCGDANVAIWQAINADKVRAYKIKYSTVHAGRCRLARARWAEKNPDSARARGAKYAAAHPDKFCIKTSHRRARKLLATTLWANKEAIEFFYVVAARCAKATGVGWHVDHIVPLQGKNVCGLHVHYNLQILTASENAKKGNKHEA